jgi:hypothetical protein
MTRAEEYKLDGDRNVAKAMALSSAAYELLEGNPDSHEVLQACGHLLGKAATAALHAALMFRLAEDPGPPSEDAVES